LNETAPKTAGRAEENMELRGSRFAMYAPLIPAS